MEAVIIFLSSLSGTFIALYVFHSFKPSTPNCPSLKFPGHAGPLQSLVRKSRKPGGVVLHSPTPEEEEKEMERQAIKNFEKASKKLKEGIIQDYRK